MVLELKYFGMVMENTEISHETIELSSGIKLMDLKELLLKNHPKLSNIHFSFSVNMEIVSNLDFTINNNSEIALLPAFAGG